MTSSASIVIFSDGGSRGNPGKAASAYLIKQDDNIVLKNAKYLGETTNNVAEYNGVMIALTEFLESDLDKTSEITFKMDSELVVKQLKGEYRIKDSNLLKLSLEVKKLINDNKLRISFVHVPRKENSFADKMVNEKLDEISRRG